MIREEALEESPYIFKEEEDLKKNYSPRSQFEENRSSHLSMHILSPAASDALLITPGQKLNFKEALPSIKKLELHSDDEHFASKKN